ncbi:hypothetical protein GCM10028797_12610 [Dyella agri]
MHLPRQRFERAEIVVLHIVPCRWDADPWQAIAAMHGTGFACTQPAVPILDADLRHRAEQKSPHWRPPEQQGCNHWNQLRADKPCEPAFAGGQGKATIRRGNQSTGKPDSFNLVGIE